MPASKVIFLLHHTGTGASANATILCSKYGYNLFRIDLSGQLSGGTVFSSLGEALEDFRFTDWAWVFFDQQGQQSLNNYQHKAEKIIYVFGCDIKGFDRPDLPGEVIKILPDVEHTQSFCSEAVIHHRFYQ